METTVSQLAAQIQELRETVAIQQRQIEVLTETSVVAQKGTHVKARIAFEEDIKHQLKAITQQVAIFKQQSEGWVKTQTSERVILMKKVQDISFQENSHFQQHLTQIKRLERDTEVISEKAKLLGRHQVEMAIQRDRGGFDGWVRFIESSKLWRITQEKLEDDWAILADYLQPQFIYDLGISRTDNSEYSAKQAYEWMYLNDDIYDGRDYLDTLWRYRVTEGMLRIKRTLPVLGDTDMEADHKRALHLVGN